MIQVRVVVKLYFSTTYAYMLRVPDSVILDVFDFLIFWVTSLFLFAWEGFGRVRGWIPLHLDQVSAQTDHSGSIFGAMYFSKSCWPRNLLPGDVVEIFRSLIYEKLCFLVGPSLGTSPVGPVVF